MGQGKELTAEDATQQSRNQNPPRRHGDTEKHGEKHNFAVIAPEIGFMLALEKSWAQEHRKKAEVTEEYVDERGNTTKLGLIFFAGKKNLADSTQRNLREKTRFQIT